MLDKTSFNIDASFKMDQNHRIIIVGGSAASGKTSFLKEIKSFYDTIGISNMDYTFDPYCKSEQWKLMKSSKEQIVLYCDNDFQNMSYGRFSERNAGLKLKVSHCLQTSYLKQVHKIFITTDTIERARYAINGQYDWNFSTDYILPHDLMNFADLILNLKYQCKALDSEYRLNDWIKIDVIKDRLSTFSQPSQNMNFFRNLSNSYLNHKNLKESPLIKNKKFMKYFYGDFATRNIRNFKELFAV